MSTARAVTASVEEQETVARWKWAGLIVALLALQVLMGGFAALLAVSDPAFAVVPDYHEQAMRWDDVVAARRASEALGWKSQVSISSAGDMFGKRALTVTLRDAAGRPLSDALLQLKLWHHARPLDIQTVRLTPDPATPGQYSGEVIARRPGLWEVELTADRGDAHFLATTRENWSFR